MKRSASRSSVDINWRCKSLRVASNFLSDEMEINLYICFVRVWKIGFEAKERALTLSDQTVGTKMYNRSSQTVLTDGSIDCWIDLDPQTPITRIASQKEEE